MSELRQAGTTKFFVSLESLRGLAALVVVVYHAVWSNPITELHFFQNGALMVDFFFVLSGFVIFHSYGRRLTNSPQIIRFLWLRVGRLYPLHLAFLLVFLAFEVAKFIAEKHLGIVADKPAFTVNNGFSFATNLLLIHSLGLHHSLTYNYPSWSISTEFYAYVLFAAVRSLCREDRKFVIVAVLVVAVSAATLLIAKIPFLSSAGVDWGFFRCCGGFFIGVLTYYAYCSIRTLRWYSNANMGWNTWLSPLALSATIAFLALVNPEGRWTYLFPLFSAFCILTVVLWPNLLVGNLLSATPLRWLGQVSYSLYMVHAAVVWSMTQVLTVVFKFPKTVVVDGHGVGTPLGIGFIVLVGYIAVVFALSNATYHRIEDPFRKRSRELAARWFTTGMGTLGSANAAIKES